MRVYEWARSKGLETKQVLEALKALGEGERTPVYGLHEEWLPRLEQYFSALPQATEALPPSPPPPPSAPAAEPHPPKPAAKPKAAAPPSGERKKKAPAPHPETAPAPVAEAKPETPAPEPPAPPEAAPAAPPAAPTAPETADKPSEFLGGFTTAAEPVELEETEKAIKRELQKIKVRQAQQKWQPGKRPDTAAPARPTVYGSGKRPKSRDRIRRDKRDRYEHAQQSERDAQELERTTLRVTEMTTVGDLATAMNLPLSDLIGKLMSLGLMVTKNQRLDLDTVNFLAEEFGFQVEKAELFDQELKAGLPEIQIEPGQLIPRPPVVTVMGHVDHGKTKVLDAIRKTKVAEGEAGGITQHIGAYKVDLPGGHVVFIDTPGHEAFTTMRARGAMVTDIVILVVSAAEGVMPQTVEAIHHIRAANVPVIVAVNKIDLPNANPDRVRTQLAELGLNPEDWGGKTPFVNISATKRINIDSLLDTILLEAEILELRSCADCRARGTVIESRVDRGRGALATILVQEGTLRVGDPLVAGVYSGKVRALRDDQGHGVYEATPSTPVEVLGLDGVPSAGDPFFVAADEKTARQTALRLQHAQREKELGRARHVSLSDLYSQIEEGKLKQLHLIVKGDVQGSVEAFCEAVEKIESEKVRVDVIHSGVGPIGVADIMLASASDAIVLGFNVPLNPKVREVAEREGVDMRTYRIIFDALNDVKVAMLGLVEPEFELVEVGVAEVRRIFRQQKGLTVAGASVLRGKLVANSQVVVDRNGQKIFEGKLESLKRFKDDAKEVTTGLECGFSLDGTEDVREGDLLHSFEQREKELKL